MKYSVCCRQLKIVMSGEHDGGGVGAISAIQSGVSQMSKSGGSKRVLSAKSLNCLMPKRHMVSSGCFFEPEEEVVPNPIVGTFSKKVHVDFDDTLYRRRSELEDIPDDFEKRMMSMGQVESGGNSE